MTPVSTSRITIIGILFCVVGAAIVARLGYLQLIQHEYYAVLASQSHSRKFEISARRGEIFMQDRGETTPVAMNRDLETLYVDTRYVYDKTGVLKELERITGTDYSQQVNEADGYVVLEEKVTRDTSQKIKDAGLSGVGLSDNFTRVYPEGTLGANLLGFVNTDGDGQYGVEEALDATLAGEDGLLSAETDARGIPIASEENVQREPEHGEDVVLTVDRNIQAFAESALEQGVKEADAKSGQAIVMDPDTGEVLAMATYPAYNPNDYQQIDNYERFRNIPVSQQFEPGSGFKVFTMATGLETGSVTPEETYYDHGSVQVGEYRIENAMGGDMTRSMRDVITHSVNTGAVYVLKQLGGSSGSGGITEADKQVLHTYFRDRFHLADRTGIEQPIEPELAMAAPDSASSVKYANMAFGQGISTTMLRMVTSMSAVINDGTLHQPRLVDYYRSRDGEVRETTPAVVEEEVVSEKTSRQIRSMMETVVEEGGGYGTRIDGYRIGGKTGTAQIPNPNGGYYDDRDIGTFTGFAPLEDPRYIMQVRINEPDVPGFAGSAAAGPVFGDIMEQLLRYGGVPPSG